MLSLVALFTAAFARAERTHADAVARLGSCEAILQHFQSSPETALPANVLQRAKALIILNQFKAGVFLGIKDGYGMIMVRKADNSWSIPVLIRAGEASFGLQLGMDDIESILVVTDPNIPKLLFKSRFNVGVDAKAVAGPHIASKERYNEEILSAPIIAYTRVKGLYAGATVKAGHISRDDQANFALYGTRYTMPELLYGDFVSPTKEAQEMMNEVKKYAP